MLLTKAFSRPEEAAKHAVKNRTLVDKDSDDHIGERPF